MSQFIANKSFMFTWENGVDHFYRPGISIVEDTDEGYIAAPGYFDSYTPGGGSVPGSELRIVQVVTIGGGNPMGNGYFPFEGVANYSADNDKTSCFGSYTVNKSGGTIKLALAAISASPDPLTVYYVQIAIFRVDGGGDATDWIYADTTAEPTIQPVPAGGSPPGFDVVTFDDGVGGGGAGDITLNMDAQTFELADPGFYVVQFEAIFDVPGA